MAKYDGIRGQEILEIEEGENEVTIILRDNRYLFVKQFSLMGSFMGGRGELLKVLGFFEDGKLKPVVDSVFPLMEAAKAQVKMEKSEHFGKIVLKV